MGGMSWKIDYPALLAMCYAWGQGCKDVSAKRLLASGRLHSSRTFDGVKQELRRLYNAQNMLWYDGDHTSDENTRRAIKVRRDALVAAGIPVFNEGQKFSKITGKRKGLFRRKGKEGSSSTTDELFNFNIPKAKTPRKVIMDYVYDNLLNGKYGLFWLRSDKKRRIYYQIEFDCWATFGRKLYREDVNKTLKRADLVVKEVTAKPKEPETDSEKLAFMCSNPDLLTDLPDYGAMDGPTRKKAIINFGKHDKGYYSPAQTPMIRDIFKICWRRFNNKKVTK